MRHFIFGKSKISHTVLYVKIKTYRNRKVCTLPCIYLSILHSQYTINSVEIRKRVVSIMKFEMHTKIISNEKK